MSFCRFLILVFGSALTFSCSQSSDRQTDSTLSYNQGHLQFLPLSPAQNLTDALLSGATLIHVCYGYKDTLTPTSDEIASAERYVTKVGDSIKTWAKAIPNIEAFQIDSLSASECDLLEKTPDQPYQKVFKLNVSFYRSESQFLKTVFPGKPYIPTLAAAQLPNNLHFSMGSMKARGQGKEDIIIHHETAHIFGLPHYEFQGSILRANTNHSLGVNQPSETDMFHLSQFAAARWQNIEIAKTQDFSRSQTL